MPDMSGWELARAIGERSGEPRPLLVAVSGHADVDSRRLSRRAGIQYHLAKPLDPIKLREILGAIRSGPSVPGPEEVDPLWEVNRPEPTAGRAPM